MLGLTIQRAYRLYELQRENEAAAGSKQPDVLSGLITATPSCCASVARSSALVLPTRQ